jgi:hypothetical protein
MQITNEDVYKVLVETKPLDNLGLDSCNCTKLLPLGLKLIFWLKLCQG